MNDPARSRLFLLIGCIVFAVIALWPNWRAFGFHDGGTASCNSCHHMHNSEDGTSIVSTFGLGALPLLKADSPSDMCLSCHGDVFGVDPLFPPPERGGGNFVFLLEDNLNDAPDGSMNPISGDAAGHNINSPSRGVAADGTVMTSPGGSFPASQLECTSCHDPHGNTNFRFLYDAGQVKGRPHTFIYDAPQAEGLNIFSGVESNSNHTAYLSGMTDWCANCHGYYHSQGTSAFSHPADRTFSSTIVDNYNLYNGSSDQTGGNSSTAYLAAVPFEDAASSTNRTLGPSTTSRLNCLSCHRAHASSAPRSGRWDFNIEFLDEDGAISGSYPIPNPYPGDPAQGPLCEKCHGSSLPTIPVAE